ncbi:MAG: 2-polyprenyl-3-methyl-6-methoxy-1,4-benzoquinone monooxygenase [Pseudomonadales bacterium]|nr:2-polyprenyl-3-methyl-6-methoxy-1,4-benzoquinone monooxygenase [Pseudomonadales bacterium]
MPPSASTPTFLSRLDQLIVQFDLTLRTLNAGSSHASRVSPAQGQTDTELDSTDRDLAAGLMRINHTGEVCAQALYQGQALIAKLPDVRAAMEQAAAEEIDHLAWCEERLQELNSRPSYLNPAWYAMSFGLGAVAGLAGDKWSLGFVAETEEQVCRHLQDHLQKLPPEDHKSRAILEQMMQDERHHGETARQAGGADLPAPVKLGMGLMSTVMKQLSYRL